MPDGGASDLSAILSRLDADGARFAALEALCAAQGREIAALTEEVAVLRPKPPRRPEDLALLRAIFDLAGGPWRVFATGEVIEASERSPSFAAVVRAAVGPGGHLGIKVGKRLGALVGVEFDGVRLERCGEDRDGALYQFVPMRR